MSDRAILDTSVLIDYWRRCRKSERRELTPSTVRSWARQLISLRRTNVIVTPVLVEMLAGVSDQKELRLTRAFLSAFRCLEDGEIPIRDWQEAVRLAQRVPSDGKPRHLGDCLIRAIANRFRYRVDTHDKDFPR